MDNKQLKTRLEKAFQEQQWNVKWNQQKEIFEVNLADHDKHFEVSIPKLQQRMMEEKKEAEEVITEVVEQVRIVQNSILLRKSVTLNGKDPNLFPVMRSTSFPTETPDGKKLVLDEHTAESRIYYALDLGESYTLIDETILSVSDWSKQELKEKALFNLRRLKNEAKKDVVADNTFYFISTRDGYGASRILNQALLQEYKNKIEGDFCLAIPHQDVLVLADIRNKTGYDVLGQLVITFYRQGNMPITMLPFDYKQGNIEPIFILASRK